MLVDAWLPRAAVAQPDRLAAGQLTYAALLEAARAGAEALRARGVMPGDQVALALEPGEDFAVALHACMLLGAVALPLDPRLTADETARLAASAVLTVDAPLARGERPGSARKGADEGRSMDSVQLEQHELDAPAIVVPTSGTSGEPKLVALSYGNWLWSAIGSAVALGLDPAERWLCCLPLSHVGGLSVLVRSAIYGTSAIVHQRFDTDRVLAELRDPGGPTIVSLVPTTLARVLDAGLREPPALRWALLGGGAIPPALLERAAAAGVPVAPTYGLTEACSQVATNGYPLFCTRVAIAADGEVLVSGPTVATSEGPTLHTGDIGALDAAGRLTITGRKADTIITGGENVAPQEVEDVLAQHPAIAQAAVHANQDAEWGETIAAIVVLRDDSSATAEELRAWCAERLAPFKVPKRISFARALPRTPSGKLLRRELGNVDATAPGR